MASRLLHDLRRASFRLPFFIEETLEMKNLVLLLSLGLVAGTASAATKPATQTKHAATATKTHHVSAEVVSADTTKNTLTIKAEDGSEKTVPVEGKALAGLKTVKAGEKVTLTCRDDDKGEHQAVTDIHAAKAPATKPVEKPKN
jgi:hypothetical protein